MARKGDQLDDRISASHIRSDGTPKRVFYTEEEAVTMANLVWTRTGRITGYYLCSQRPDHWHVGSGVADLERQ